MALSGGAVPAPDGAPVRPRGRGGPRCDPVRGVAEGAPLPDPRGRDARVVRPRERGGAARGVRRHVPVRGGPRGLALRRGPLGPALVRHRAVPPRGPVPPPVQRRVPDPPRADPRGPDRRAAVRSALLFGGGGRGAPGRGGAP